MAVLISMIIIASAITVIAVGMGLNSITENQINLAQSYSSRVLLNTDGCAEEALTRMNRNSSYTGETITLDNTSCVITISGTGTSRTITATSTNGIYSKIIQITVTIFPTFTINSWLENT